MRKRLYALAILAALVVADALLWRVGVGQLEAGLDRWAAQARASGWTVSAGPRRRGGFPFKAVLTVSGVSLEGGARLMPGGVAWEADRLKLEVSMLHPATLVLSPSGPQHLRLSHALPLVFTAGRLRVAVPLTGADGGGAATVEASGVQGGIAGSPHPRDVQLASFGARLTGHAGRDGSVSARLDVQVAGLGLPDNGRWPLSANIAELGGTLLLSSPRLSGQRGATGDADPEDQARAWRDGGGALVGHELRLRWGPLAVTAEARLGLDERLQPAGSGSAEVAGAGAALDALAVGGVVQPGVAATTKAVLALMPSATATSGPLAGQDVLHLPFQLRQSTVTVAQIPVVQLGEIAWRRPPPR